MEITILTKLGTVEVIRGDDLQIIPQGDLCEITAARPQREGEEKRPAFAPARKTVGIFAGPASVVFGGDMLADAIKSAYMAGVLQVSETSAEEAEDLANQYLSCINAASAAELEGAA